MPTKQLVEVYRKLCVVLAEDIDANYMVCLKEWVCSQAFILLLKWYKFVCVSYISSSPSYIICNLFLLMGITLNWI